MRLPIDVRIERQNGGRVGKVGTGKVVYVSKDVIEPGGHIMRMSNSIYVVARRILKDLFLLNMSELYFLMTVDYIIGFKSNIQFIEACSYLNCSRLDDN